MYDWKFREKITASTIYFKINLKTDCQPQVQTVEYSTHTQIILAFFSTYSAVVCEECTENKIQKSKAHSCASGF